jgi:hypothetical protein
MSIKNHYIPKKYLRQFSVDSQKIIVYDRVEDKIFKSSVDNLGSEKNLYTDEMEKGLANLIEDPVNIVFDKFQNKMSITDEEKFRFSEYLCVFLKRTTKFKKHIEDQKRVTLLREESTTNLQEKFGISVEKALSINQSIIDDDKTIWERIMEPGATPSVVIALHYMTWTVYYSNEPCFITSDHPLFYPKQLGFAGNPYTEFSFPLTNSSVLLGSWEKTDFSYKHAYEKVIEEFNKRTRMNYFRFIYSPYEYFWLSRQVSKKVTYTKLSKVKSEDQAKKEYNKLKWDHEEYNLYNKY